LNIFTSLFSVFESSYLENIPYWGKNILKDGANEHLWEQAYTKYNKINNNSKNFRGERLPLLPLSCGPDDLYNLKVERLNHKLCTNVMRKK